MNRWISWPQGPKKGYAIEGMVTAAHITPQSIIMTHCSSAKIITSSNHMQIISPLSSHFGSAAICSFKSFVQKDSRFQSISEGLGRGRCFKFSSCHWVCQAIKVSHGFKTSPEIVVCLRGWSFKKVADMGGFLAGCTSACNHLRCYAQQMWRNILIQVGERKRCWIEWPFSRSFSNMNKDGIPKISSCNTVPPRPLHP